MFCVRSNPKKNSRKSSACKGKNTIEGIILAMLIQYVVEYRFADAFFRILVDGYK